MNDLKKNLPIIFSIAVLIFLSSTFCRAQNIWLDQHENSISLDINRPIFNGDENFNFPSYAITLYGRYSVSDKVSLVADIPFANANFSLNSAPVDISRSNFIAGNIYLGTEIASSNKPFVTELGIRIPTASDELFASSILANSNYDRIESYVADFMSVAARGNYFFTLSEPIQLRVRAGLNAFIHTGSESGIENELLTDYVAQFIYKKNVVQVKAGLSGQLLISEDDLDLGERVINSFGLGVDFDLNGFYPGLGLKLPLDEEISDFIDAVVSVNVTKRF